MSNTLKAFVFGRFRVQYSQRVLNGLDACKTQELLCYLFLYRNRSHPREVLVDLLWQDHEASQSRRYLSKVLWQIQTALEAQTDSLHCRLLLTESDWVQLNPDADLWLDVAVFEQAFALTQGLQGRELDPQRFQILLEAVKLYRGDLLVGFYQNWCVYERERLQYIYLAMLDKLMDHCEACQEYEAGLDYGSIILRYDRARERTHRRLMRLHYLSANRTAALRQYQQCVVALKEELSVEPSERTAILYQQIRTGRFGQPVPAPAEARATPEGATLLLLQVLASLRRFDSVLVDVQRQVHQDIRAVESALHHKL